MNTTKISTTSRDQMEYEKAIEDAEMRKIFPPIEEQMDLLEPELQVELFNIEQRYERDIQVARAVRQEILDTKHDLYDANVTCQGMVEVAIETRKEKIKKLKETWGNFFYNKTK